MAEAKFDINNIVRGKYNCNIKITGVKKFRLRNWLGIRLLILAAKTFPFDCLIEVKDKE